MLTTCQAVPCPAGYASAARVCNKRAELLEAGVKNLASKADVQGYPADVLVIKVLEDISKKYGGEAGMVVGLAAHRIKYPRKPDTFDITPICDMGNLRGDKK